MAYAYRCSKAHPAIAAEPPRLPPTRQPDGAQQNWHADNRVERLVPQESGTRMPAVHGVGPSALAGFPYNSATPSNSPASEPTAWRNATAREASATLLKSRLGFIRRLSCPATYRTALPDACLSVPDSSWSNRRPTRISHTTSGSNETNDSTKPHRAAATACTQPLGWGSTPQSLARRRRQCDTESSRLTAAPLHGAGASLPNFQTPKFE